MLIKNLKDCEEFTAGDNSLLRELLHPDKTDLACPGTLVLNLTNGADFMRESWNDWILWAYRKIR